MARAIVIGVFDLFHYGHVEKFKKLEELGFEVVVGVTTGKFTSKYKRTPIMSFNDRVKMVKQCTYVDSVLKYTSHTSLSNFLDFYGINVLVYGSDWTSETYLKHMKCKKQDLINKGIVELQLPYTKEISTTEIIERCKNA